MSNVISVNANTYSVSGTVVDAKTKKPLAGAFVFINQTSHFSVTDSAGKFALDQLENGYFDLVVSKNKYELLAYRFAAKTAATAIRFEIITKEVTIPGLPDSIIIAQQQSKWLPVFRAYFMGHSQNAAQCEIINPEVLRFHFIDSLQLLKITATAPLMVSNEALGYMMNFVMNECIIEQNGEVESNLFLWYKLLTSKAPLILKKWSYNRSRVYDGSLLHFMRSLYADTLAAAGFDVRMITRVFEGEPGYNLAKKERKNRKGQQQYRLANNDIVVKKFVDVTDLHPTPSSEFRAVDTTNRYVLLTVDNKIVQVKYKKINTALVYSTDNNPYMDTELNYVSYLVFSGKKKILVERNGSFYEPEDITFDGAWHWLGLANKLPDDYTLK